MTPWDAVVAATEGHNIDSINVHLDDESRAWTYIRCTCYNGPDNEPFTESWQFTNHIRRIVFDAMSAVSSAVDLSPNVTKP